MSNKDVRSKTYVNSRKVRNGQMPVSTECCSQCGCWKKHLATSPGGRQPQYSHFTLTVSTFLDFFFFTVLEIESKD